MSKLIVKSWEEEHQYLQVQRWTDIINTGHFLRNALSVVMNVTDRTYVVNCQYTNKGDYKRSGTERDTHLPFHVSWMPLLTS